jgi:hypothetical protein
MASSANPYEHYNNPHVEDDDLIDPDDGTYFYSYRLETEVI